MKDIVFFYYIFLMNDSNLFQIVRRSSLDEKFLVIAKKRFGHFCSKFLQVIAIISWEGVERQEADDLYEQLKHVLPEFGIPTEVRRPYF